MIMKHLEHCVIAEEACFSLSGKLVEYLIEGSCLTFSLIRRGDNLPHSSLLNLSQGAPWGNVQQWRKTLSAEKSGRSRYKDLAVIYNLPAENS